VVHGEDALRLDATVVGARNSATLGNLHIFVDHFANSVTSDDRDVGGVGLGECSERSSLAERSVWSMGIEVGFVFGEGSAWMLGVEDEHSVEEFSMEAADPAFHDRVCSECSDRGFDDLDAFAGEDRVEHASELGVPVADQECEL
jgi:hypothetical protein